MLTEGNMFLQNVADRTVMLTEGSIFLQNVGDGTLMLTEGNIFLHDAGYRPFVHTVSQSVWNLWWTM